jgi:ElaB/YqjD/DUF883 family membrane-anchored ribosome-binding protein
MSPVVGTTGQSEPFLKQTGFICREAVVAKARRRCEDESRKGTTMEATEHGDNEKHELRAKLEAATEKAKEVCKRLQEETVAAAKATDKSVREQSYQAIGIAFGVGLLIGVVATLRRCRHD